VAFEVGDAAEAYNTSVKFGAVGIMVPRKVIDHSTNTSITLSEIQLFGDVVIRFLSGTFTGPALPNYVSVPQPPMGNRQHNIGIERIDHCVSNVHELLPAVEYLQKALGLHEFGEFTTDDVGTTDSGLNSVVLANNNEFILLPVNEPTYGTKRKSQIEGFLEQHNGPGIQHIALKTNNIIGTVREMQSRSHYGDLNSCHRL
jgi:4-hydroxyphenylpyruvate dioxygenase